MKSEIDRLARLVMLYFSRSPIYLILFVTSRCNMRCKMCFNWKNQKDLKKELSLEEINKISFNFPSLLQLTLGGGEPFLRDDIPSIIEIFYKNNNARFFTISTNAFFPEKIGSDVRGILKRCPHALLNVGLSLDGVAHLHDEIRDCQGSFERLLETYQHLKTIRKEYPNFYIKVTTVISSFNSDKVGEILAFVKDHMDIDDHEILLARGETRLEGAKDVVSQRYKQLIKIFDENAKRNLAKRKYQFSRLFYGLSRHMNKIVFETLEKNQMILPCLAGRRLIEIYEDGTVRPCEILHTLPARIDSAMGNLRDFNYDIKEILKSEKAKNILKYIKKHRCFCTFECALMTNIIFNPRTYPKLIKNALKIKEDIS